MAMKRRKNIGRKFTGKMQANLLLVFCIVIALFLALIGRLLMLHNKDGERYTKKVLSQQTYVSSALPYKRGDIVDRNNTKLATSSTVYNVIVAPKTILEKEEYKAATIKAIVDNFEITEEEINKIIEENSSLLYKIILKNLSYDDISNFEKLQEDNKNIKGVWFEKKYKRKYPLNSVACDVIGFTTADNTGLWGLEGYYNEQLNGTVGREYGYFDSDLNLERTVKSAQNGNTLVTTIDANIQTIVEEKIADFMKKTGGKNVAAIVMNPNNGEIYAMASNVRYDLNNPFDLTPLYTENQIKKMTEEEKTQKLNEMWGNFCISHTFEPGSTFKPLTIAAALDQDIIKNNTLFTCDGGEHVEGWSKRISCVNREGHGTITTKQSLMFSCNDVLMQVAARLGKNQFDQYQHMFNMGSKTGIDLPGEATGLIATGNNLNQVSMATSSFGQTLSVNMVQIASAISSVVNGGNYYQPHLVKQILNDNGTIVENIDPVLVRKTVSEATCKLIREDMLDTVSGEGGTGSAVKIKGYEIGGKTGTAQKRPAKDKKYLVSFIGMAPADNPDVVVFAVVDEPNVEDQAHSTYATEIVRAIMKDTFPFLNIYPTGETEEEDNKTKAANAPEQGDGNSRQTNSKATAKPTNMPVNTTNP